MSLLPADNVNSQTSLVTGSPLTTTSTTLQVSAGTGQNFPSSNFVMRLGSLLAHDSELVHISTVSGLDTFTIDQRAINGTTPEAWPIGTVVQAMVPVNDDTVSETVASLLCAVGGFAPINPTLKANAAQALATSGTIATSGLTVSRVNPAAPSTAVILAPGTQDGQVVVVENDSANLVTFAAAVTSNVADGTSDTIATLTSAIFVWNATGALWYRIKAA